MADGGAHAVKARPMSALERLQALQSTAASFNRYLGSVRAATTGIESVHGAGIRGAAELNDYADQVEDVEQQLFERRQWCSVSTNEIHRGSTCQLI